MSESNERSWGQALSDVAGNMLAAGARGGGTASVLLSGIDAGLNTENFQSQKQKRVNAVRLAELQLENQELANQRLMQLNERDAELHQWRKEDRPLQREGLETELEGKKYDTENRKTVRDINLLRLQQAQLNAWNNNAQNEINAFKNNLKNAVGYDALNFTGQTIYDNSSGVNEMAEAAAILKAFDRSPEEGKALISKTGWSFEEDKSGKSRGFIVSPDGNTRITADDKSLKALMAKAKEDMKNDLAASMAMGSDAMTLEQFAVKNILSAPGTEQVFGSYGSALGAYKRFVNGQTYDVETTPDGRKKTMTRERFTREEKLGHVLSRSLSSAILDGKITQQEQAVLTPLFAASVKKFGAEVIFGQDAATSKVRMRDGSEVPLVKFAQDLAERDVISAEWRRNVAAINAKANQNQKQQNINANNDTAWKYRLDGMFGSQFRDADTKTQKKLINAAVEMQQEQKGVMQQAGAKTLGELPTDKLRLLDSMWKNKVDDEKFYSPYEDEVFLRERESLYQAKRDLERELKQKERTTSEYQEHLHGRRGPTAEQKSLTSLKKQLLDINKQIKFREEKLRNRRINFKEYK